jgi:hypothetical protein
MIIVIMRIANLSSHLIQRSFAWLALLCYGVLLLHTLLAHAGLFTKADFGTDRFAAVTAQISISAGDDAATDCAVCHLGANHPPVGFGSNQSLPELSFILDRISVHAQYYFSRFEVQIHPRGPPVA